MKVRKYRPALNMALLEVVVADGLANRLRRYTGHIAGCAVSSARLRARVCVCSAFCSLGWFFVDKSKALIVSIAFGFAVV